MTPTLSTLAEDLAVALSWSAVDRWVIGDTMRRIRELAGEDALWQSVPDDPKAARLAAKCLRVADRWPRQDARDAYPALGWSHFARVQWLDDAGAAAWLAAAEAGGWTGAQLGRAMAGFDADEPAVAIMAAQLAGDGYGLKLSLDGDGWMLSSGVLMQNQPSIGAAIKAAWRVRFGKAAPKNVSQVG